MFALLLENFIIKYYVFIYNYALKEAMDLELKPVFGKSNLNIYNGILPNRVVRQSFKLTFTIFLYIILARS